MKYAFRYKKYLLLVCTFLYTFILATAQPTYLSSSPSRNALNISTNENIILTFDQNIASVSVNASNIVVSGTISGRISGSFLGAGTSSITFDPTNDYFFGEIITVTITNGLNNNLGQPLSNPQSFQFTTISQSAPAVFPQGSQIIDNPSTVYSIYPIDMDKDRDLDLVTIIATDSVVWYENNGTQNFTVRNISTTIEDPAEAYPADIDNDGDIDVVVAFSGPNGDQLTWFENDGAQNFTPVTLAINYFMVSDVFVTDLDNDGDRDILSTAIQFFNSLEWFQNDGSQNFTQSSLTTGIFGASDIYAGDVDSDGDIDALTTAGNLSMGNKVFWHENDGAQNFNNITIDSTSSPSSVFMTDIDGDGDNDVVASINVGSRVRWYENDGSQNFTTYDIDLVTGAIDIHAADINGDGYTDILSSGGGRFIYYENDGAQNFSVNNLMTGVSLAGNIISADLDGDGDLDIIAESADGIMWFENAFPPEIDVDQAATNIISGATTIDFGTTTQGTDITLVFDVQNIGTELPLAISSITSSGSTFTVNNALSSINAGLGGTFEVTIDASSVGTFSEIITITNNDLDNPDFTFAVTGEVISSNTPPTISSIDDLIIDEDMSAGPLSFTINDAETSPTDLSVTTSSDNTSLVPLSAIVINGTGSNLTLEISPVANGYGTCVIDILVSDGALSANESFLLTVTPVNDIPVITAQSVLTVSQNDEVILNLSDFVVTDPDNTYPDDFELIVNSGSNYSVSNTTVIPDQDYSGMLSIPVMVNDGTDNSAIYNASMEVLGGEIEVVINGEGLINGDEIEFEDVFIGDEDTQELIISNPGSISLIINDITIDNNDFSLRSEVPSSIDPSENISLLLAFTPSSTGARSARLLISSENAVDFVVILRANGLSENPSIEVVNVLTTPKNGKHDFLEIRNIEFYPDNRVFIYSRWGDEIFKTNNYDNASNRFEGNSDDGELLAEGTYYYIIELNDEGDKTIKDGFFLLRN